MTITMTMAAAATATTTCPGRAWGRSEGLPAGLTPSPPRYFTFEPPAATGSAPRPRRRHPRRVLYPPAVRRPLPAEEPSAAKRLLLLLLAVVGAQVYNTPEEGTPDTLAVPPQATAVPPQTLRNIPEAPRATPVAPAAAFCPRSPLPSAFRAPNSTISG
ncbi:LOW QUALITY PROTEIN: radiation-inducible immediate-early gene IEX-1 [Phaenicophaeus curvirostris]|uniref:LOW QUALITY PROTEIN: radiation-inducible immediate-early gene IEX-1 n=1 Tax=Phaenicophaeus curvirostris TaxID=33595 RepID=UPI0037F0DADE